MEDTNRTEWLRERKNYIGGSDIGCILGLNPRKSALDVYLEKTTDVIDESMSEAAYWGIVFEDPVAQEYSKRTGLKVQKSEGVIKHPKHKFLGANIDRWVKGTDETFILECKTTHFFQHKEWGEEGTDQIPQLYLCQIAYYAAICNVSRVDVAVLIGGQNFRMYTYLKNKEFEDELIRAGCIFWNNYILKGIAPNANNLKDVAILYPKSNGCAIQANKEIVADIEKLKNLKEQEKILASNKIFLETKIKNCIGENEILTNEQGEVLVTWKSGQPKQILDAFRLQKEQQNIYQQYLVEKETSRTFLIK